MILSNFILSNLLLASFLIALTDNKESRNFFGDSRVEPTDTIKGQDSIGKPYFIYDEVDHYFNDYDPSSEENRYDRNFVKTKLDSLELSFIYGSTPTDTSDFEYISYLEKIGFKRTALDKNRVVALDRIFIEKERTNFSVMRCIYTYRDILVFKKNGKIVGVVKICFQCDGHIITGTTANTDGFGSDDDFKYLKMILRN